MSSIVICDEMRFLIDPFMHGICSVYDSCTGTKTHLHENIEKIFDRSLARRPDLELSIVDRITSFAVGLLLLIPIINSVVFAILEELAPSFLYEIHSSGEDYYQMFLNGGCLAIQEFSADDESVSYQIENRRTNCSHYQTNPDIGQNLRLRPEIRNFNLDLVLSKYKTFFKPDYLMDIFAYGEISEDLRASLNGRMELYNRRNLDAYDHKIKEYLSQIFDFLERQERVFKGTDQEQAFKGQIQYIAQKIEDAHRGCSDQTMSQIEQILVDQIAGYEIAAEAHALSSRDYLKLRTSYEIFKYTSNLIKEICVRLYPGEPHMADFERLMKRELMGSAKIHRDGAHYEFWTNNQIRQRKAQIMQRFTEEFRPEEFLLNHLTPYFGNLKKLRNDLFIWIRKHFDLEKDDGATNEFIRQISENPDQLSIENGGNLKEDALRYCLQEIGVFEFSY